MPPRPYEIRSINGIDHKLCRGPLHENGGKWIATTHFRFRGDGSKRLRANCNHCEFYRRYSKIPTKPIEQSGYVEYSPFIRNCIMEIERRLGRSEAFRRTGIPKVTWYRLIDTKRKQKRINRATLAKIVAVVYELRQTGEVRHKKCIRRGSYLRGEPEITPSTKNDYYVSITDTELEYRRSRNRRTTA